MSDAGASAAPDPMRRRLGPALVALLFGAAAVSELAELVRWMTGDNTAPAALHLARIPSATAAILTAVGAWRGQRWAWIASAAWGVATAIELLLVGVLLGLPREARGGLGLAAALVLAVAAATALYLRWRTRRPVSPPS